MSCLTFRYAVRFTLTVGKIAESCPCRASTRTTILFLPQLTLQRRHRLLAACNHEEVESHSRFAGQDGVGRRPPLSWGVSQPEGLRSSARVLSCVERDELETADGRAH